MVSVYKTWTSTAYDHIRTAENEQNIIFLCLGGSHAYGTNVEGSDVDIRGVMFEPKSHLIGLGSFEQLEDKATDTVIYGFNKLVGLLINCNPNVIEMLGNNKEDYQFGFHANIGMKLIDNVNLFLSQRAVNSFGGYANSQLRRLQNAVGRERVSDDLKAKHVLGSVKNAWEGDNGIAARHGIVSSDVLFSFADDGQFVFNMLRSDDNPFGYANSTEFCAALSEVNNIVRTYDKLNHRNTKKDDAHLNKHAMHLVRLYIMGLEILERGIVITHRAAEHELLMSIRNGDFQNEDGTFTTRFFEMVDEYDKRFQYAKDHTALPKQPDMKAIEELVMEINMYNLRRKTT